MPVMVEMQLWADKYYTINPDIKKTVLKEIKKEADAGNARAKKAKKLLQDGRFKK